MNQIYIADAFTDRKFEGNQAGVVLIENTFPSENTMRLVAAELRCSETALVKRESEGLFSLRYFTPTKEVPLCGHATVSAFAVLRDEKMIALGNYRIKTKAGIIKVEVLPACIWLEMFSSNISDPFPAEDTLALYHAFRLDSRRQPHGIKPCIANSGALDILLPVFDKHALDGAVPDRSQIIALCERFGVVGVHMFALAQDPHITAYCRNFAPLYGIDEESATGTSTASLTCYLSALGYLRIGEENVFVQGEAMGKAARIKSRLETDGAVSVGGNAVITVKGEIDLP